jgi:hypothetical protein
MDILHTFLDAADIALEGVQTQLTGSQNIGLSATVGAVCQSLNRSAEAGRIEDKRCRFLKKQISRRDPAQLDEAFDAYVHDNAVPMDAFIDAFLHHSPDMKPSCAQAPRELRSREIADQCDPRILDLVESMIQKK